MEALGMIGGTEARAGMHRESEQGIRGRGGAAM